MCFSWHKVEILRANRATTAHPNSAPVGLRFTCALLVETERLSVCFAFELYGRAWEIRGVVTTPSHRRLGLGSRVIRVGRTRAAGPIAGNQVGEDNQPSIRLARSIGMTQFLTVTYYLHFEVTGLLT